MGFGLVIGFIGNFNTQLVTTHKDWCSQSWSSLLCLVKSSNSGCSSAPRLTFSQAGGHLTPTSYSPDFCLRSVSQLTRNCSWPLLYSLGTDHTENTDLLLLVACLLQPSHDGAVASNGSICRAVPYQRLSLLASQFWLSDMPQYIYIHIIKL
jgi:hypothetical protein